MKESEIIYTDQLTVSCSGESQGVAGHPQIYLTFNSETSIVCPYCSRTFTSQQNSRH